ncbi:TPA: hypothetical protein ACSK7E_000948 [Listeria innocua]|nr:hypothetical protein [Listeria innocua]EIM1737224.1 hypothetical protein [Listeria monocytogenes]HBM4323061.1 hypothetical protein [Listeria innocua]
MKINYFYIKKWKPRKDIEIEAEMAAVPLVLETTVIEIFSKGIDLAGFSK